METTEIPDGAMEIAENAGLVILNIVRKLFFTLFGEKYNFVIVAIHKDEKHSESYAILSDLDDHEIERVMHEAARRSSSGTMLSNHDQLETKH